MATRNTRRSTASQNTPAVKVAEKSSDLVTVCLRLHSDIAYEIDDRRIVIKGHNSHLRGVNGGVLDSGSAFGETTISRKDWEAIKRKYFSDKNQKLYPTYIFAYADRADALAEAKEKEDLLTGLEPIDPKKTRTKADKAS